MISEAEHKLQGLYDRYLQDPQIGVHVLEYRSQRVAVVGAVQNPGVFELSGPKTVVDLLATARGLNGTASSQIHLYRQTPEGRTSYVIDLLTLTKGIGSNVGVLTLPVQNGDVITVPEAGSFFVDGAVRRPGSFPLTRPYTVSQALVLAGGVDREIAKTSGITLFRRRAGAEPENVSLNLSDILSGEAQDPVVGAEDVIVVPISAPKYVVRRFLGVLVSGFSLERAVMPY
jgi:polysaccharide export outer membrane protein